MRNKFMKFSYASTLVVLGAVALASMPLAWTGAAQASQARRDFYHGDWNCNLHGRSARMIWTAHSGQVSTCKSDGSCEVTYRSYDLGRFKDGSGPWVKLEALGTSSQSITFRHADGNKWYLANTGRDRMTGHSTWQGNQYPLACWR